MTTSPEVAPRAFTTSRWIAAELRAEIARVGLSRREVGRRIGQDTTWMSRRLSPEASGAVNLTFEEVEDICFVIGMDADELIARALRARRDSNPQPSDLEPVVLRLLEGGRIDPPLFPQVEGKPTLPPKLALVVA